VSTVLFHGQIVTVVVNKHNIARVASCWFIIYYRLLMHRNTNIRLIYFYSQINKYVPEIKFS